MHYKKLESSGWIVYAAAVINGGYNRCHILNLTAAAFQFCCGDDA
jgi:hypothetical protein